MHEKVKEVLESVNSSLAAHGGGVELMEVSEDGIVKVRLTGGCAGCPMSQMTLKMGIERILKQQIPEIQQVEAV